ncbi:MULTISPECIES: SDR family NAD(P)-dependent oxidoreductase [Agrobacterium]|uniref:SDR family oxidoreductase n=1 Tax=Agrobacterium tumefaciens TaxID=358 RepID=A0AAE6BJ99_AGRTU|nr:MULTISPECIES: SDR family oxidoreductase [Agrobacterium]QCL77108.1 SDR family oxidoreductase [Agrobacterium tumefaciens]QCL82617.1 SDR family oxidoreductase [Agrobacterium tumefaciens]CUX70148.1 Oxidoreductase protein [Agrobacterium sp. NCPPB 925]
MNFDQEFKGKKVVLTGAGGIIGGWIANAFAAEGAQVCLTDRAVDRIESRKAQLPGSGHLTFAAELTDAASLSAFAAFVEAEWGAPDILVNNAGIYPSGFLLDISVDDWDAMFDINLRAPFILSQLFARQMVAGGKGGSIVNISSGAARKMRSTVVPYCTSKTALDRLTKGFALELAEYGIRVNAVEPGFAAGSDVSTLTEEHVSNVTAAIPLGRASSAQDVAAAVLYVTSEAGSYVTGATLTVDGGNSIGSQVVFQAKKKAL